ncbi:IS1 family transposase [Hymenobacter gummosus]|uniref:IS1 family transposase n=1 Tax=Hymenobacter gummosus TaxID=1776032 RepID=UPI003C7705DE
MPTTCRGTTNHIERCNATLRARIGRLVRKSLSFSRSLKLLDACVNLPELLPTGVMLSGADTTGDYLVSANCFPTKYGGLGAARHLPERPI